MNIEPYSKEFKTLKNLLKILHTSDNCIGVLMDLEKDITKVKIPKLDLIQKKIEEAVFILQDLSVNIEGTVEEYIYEELDDMLLQNKLR